MLECENNCVTLRTIIYPTCHTQIRKDKIKAGGLLSKRRREFRGKAERQLRKNHIQVSDKYKRDKICAYSGVIRHLRTAQCVGKYRKS
jgi:hypothetical protein